jgi:hypothetical protein
MVLLLHVVLNRQLTAPGCDVGHRVDAIDADPFAHDAHGEIWFVLMIRKRISISPGASLARQSSTAILCGDDRARPLIAERLPDMSVITLILTVFDGAACALVIGQHRQESGGPAKVPPWPPLPRKTCDGSAPTRPVSPPAAMPRFRNGGWLGCPCGRFWINRPGAVTRARYAEDGVGSTYWSSDK